MICKIVNILHLWYVFALQTACNFVVKVYSYVGTLLFSSCFEDIFNGLSFILYVVFIIFKNHLW